jgi:DNA invertase Pin-like site-specific DNA recombinase
MKPVKLTWEKVDQIRAMHQHGVIGYKTVARQFGVSETTIKAIIKGKIWDETKRWPEPCYI